MLLRWLFYAYVLIDVSFTFNIDLEHPIIYQVAPNRSTYFGMSVALRPKASNMLDTWSIQIGAPRDNIPGMNVKEPGAIYRCHIYGPCRMFLVDRTFNDVGGLGVYAYRDKKDEAWIGVSMDIKDFVTHEKSIICGHRWINQNLKNPENIDITYLMTGVCYYQELYNDTSESPVQKLLPLVDTDKIYTPKPYVVDLSTYHWGLGQAGVSVTLTSDPDGIIIGAPGVTHWIGSLIRYEPDFKVLVGDFLRTEITKKNRYTYLGYSIAAGRFYKDKEIWFAAGAPRSSNYRGEVFIFQYQTSSDRVLIRSNLVGSSFGEYFGSSLAASDINGDGIDDLLVGAPLHSKKDPDEGKLYVFLGTGQGNFLLPSQSISGQSGHGRFGSCVTAIGDLDQDGFRDIAVGAPYEYDGRGAVYIFRGYPSGLRTEYSQRIGAEDIYPYLRGFGVSISPAVDVDGNKYRDVAVGSFLSGHVVLMRSRPVVLLRSDIKTGNMTLIDRRDNHFNVTFCSKYSGMNSPSFIDLLQIIEIDPIFGRGFLDSRKTSSFNKKLIRIKLHETFCEILPIYLNVSTQNYSPMPITLKNELPSCNTNKKSPVFVTPKTSKLTDNFLKWCPTGKNVETSKQIGFAGICGADQVCRSNLKLLCSVPEFRTGSYILGSSENFILSVNIQNSGEPAQNTKLKIWSSTKLILKNNKNSNLGDYPQNVYWIDVESTLIDSHNNNFVFRIPFDEIKDIRKNDFQGTILTIIVEVFTSSFESNLDDNKCKFAIKLTSEAFVDLYASSSSSSALIPKSDISYQLYNVTHYYEIKKTGKTPVKEAQLTIYIPFKYGSEFLTYEIETADWMHLALADEEVRNRNKDDHSVDVALKDTLPPSNRTLFLNCSNSQVQCHEFKVYFAAGIPNELPSYVKILLLFNMTTISLLDDDKDIFHFSTWAVLKYAKLLEVEETQTEESASVCLYYEERAKQVEMHVIALSILAGGFLLCLIVTGMAKSNFFRRNKKEELEALKEAEAEFIHFVTKE